MIITEKHFEKSLAILQVTEQEMPNAFYGLGLSSQADVYAKILSFIEDRESFDWTEFTRAFHMDVENISQLRGYVEMAEQSGVIMAETSATSSRWATIKTKQEVDRSGYLDDTVFRLMDRNLLKNK